MRSTRRLFVLALLAAVSLTALAAAPQYTTNPGSYALTPMTDWDRIKNDQRGDTFLPLLLEKPESLTEALSDAEQAVATYAFIKLGTAQDGTYVVFGRQGGINVDFLYVDADNDKNLDAAELVELKKNSPFSNRGVEIQWTESIKPVTCTASYTRNDGTIVTRPVSLQFNFLRVTIPSGRSGSATKYIGFYVTNTWFTGTGRFKVGKDEKETAFAILDGNDNGVFNDYGRDILIVDANGDGQFDMEKEIVQLLEFDETKLDSKTVAQNRKAMFAWPTALVVKPAQEAVDWNAVEPN